MAKLGYDQYQSIRFRGDHSLWGDAGLAFRLQFFHVGRNFSQPVRMHEVVDGQAREIIYDPAMFEWDKSGIDPATMKDRAGFAGFRVQFVTNWRADVAAFLGASYFRAVGGDTRQYGLVGACACGGHGVSSPRGVSPVHLFLVRAAGAGLGNDDAVCADGQSEHRRRTAHADLARRHADHEHRLRLYPRKPIERLGIAPLTSMFFYGKNDRRAANDWRPEIHDSDGLSMWTGAGEWIWRPLINPAQLHLNSYFDDNPARLRLAAAGPQLRSLSG